MNLNPSGKTCGIMIKWEKRVGELKVVLPYSLYGFHRLFTAHLIDGNSFTTLVLVGALLFVPLVLAARQLGKLLTRS
jgi:hypothetical protein